MTFLIAKAVGGVVPLRVEDKLEMQGLDVALHGEEGYTDGEGALLIPMAPSSPAAGLSARPLGGKA